MTFFWSGPLDASLPVEPRQSKSIIDHAQIALCELADDAERVFVVATCILSLPLNIKFDRSDGLTCQCFGILEA
ncbi:hypothetical protein DPMN_143164 [Dreissena polymorpha]|uniref:Uncharacterized protein n=1 Tax=Dreissena polymorpha TaxID=45954 RepID=A0A9D4GCK7_DREPO|nr:hypothetical protein DPMN_143164 [Dreissena polymorpha]